MDPDYITRSFNKLTETIEEKLTVARVKAKKEDPEIPEYNLDIRFHDLRHCHATTLLEAGINVKAVSERLGHSTTRTTLDIYTHVTKSMQKEIADRIDSLFASDYNPLAK